MAGNSDNQSPATLSVAPQPAPVAAAPAGPAAQFTAGYDPATALPTAVVAAGTTTAAPEPARVHRVRHNDIELAVFEYGRPDGVPVVLVHGWPDTHHLWDGVIPLLPDHFRVLAYDTRGYGESSAPRDVPSYRLDRLATDFFAIVDQLSPDEPVHVIAHDWGSVRIWEAICEPGADEYVRSFTSISGPNLDHLARFLRTPLRQPSPRALWHTVTQALSSAYTAFFMLPLVSDLFFRIAGTPRLWKLFLRTVEGTRAEQIHVAGTLRTDMISGLRFYRANIVPRMFGPRDRYTTVPVQLLVSTRDIAVRPAGYDDYARWTTELVRHDLPRGHWLPFSEPAAIVAHAGDFIATHSTYSGK